MTKREGSGLTIGHRLRSWLTLAALLPSLALAQSLPGHKNEKPVPSGKNPADYVTGADINQIVTHAQNLAATHAADKAAQATRDAGQDSRMEGLALGIPGDPSALAVQATGSTTARSLKDRFADEVNVKDFGAKCDGVTDDSAAFAAAVASLPDNTQQADGNYYQGGTITIPAHVICRVNIVITGRSGVTFRGGGRRSTFLKPFIDAPVIHYSADDGNGNPRSMQSHGLEDLGMRGVAGYTSSAIKISGPSNYAINDWYKFERLNIADYFSHAFEIVGRTIWSSWNDIEISNTTSHGFYLNVSGQAFNGARFMNVSVSGCGGDGIYLWASALPGHDSEMLNTYMEQVDSEGNAGNGLTVHDFFMLGIRNSYFENNGGDYNIKFTGTYAVGFTIENSLIWGTYDHNDGNGPTLQDYGVIIDAEFAQGVIQNNRIVGDVSPLVVTSGHEKSNVQIGSNYWGGGPIIAPVDGNGRAGVSGTSPLALRYETSFSEDVVAGAVDVSLKNILRFTTDVTISKLTGGLPGQIVYLTVDGTNKTITLVHGSGADALYFVSGQDVTIRSGKSLALIKVGDSWRPLSESSVATLTGPVGINGNATSPLSVYSEPNYGKNTDGLGTTALYVNGGDNNDTAITIKAQPPYNPLGSWVGALKFQASPDAANYNTAALRAVTASNNNKIERFTFYLPDSNTDGENMHEVLSIKNTLVGGGTVFADTAGALTLTNPTAVPASASSPCAKGAFAADADFFYTCISPGTWRRVALTTW